MTEIRRSKKGRRVEDRKGIFPPKTILCNKTQIHLFLCDTGFIEVGLNFCYQATH